MSSGAWQLKNTAARCLNCLGNEDGNYQINKQIFINISVLINIF